MVLMANSNLASTGFNLETVLEVSQILACSSKDDILHQLLQISVRQAGCDRGCILLPDADGEWHVVTSVSNSHPETDHPFDPETARSTVPTMQCVQYVLNTHKPLIVEGGNYAFPTTDCADREPQPYADSNYSDQPNPRSAWSISSYPQSFVCLPMLYRGQMSGVLSVSHTRQTGLFTAERLLGLKVLCSQGAIALANLQLRQKVELAQCQRVQDQKMVALGNLVAGIAHEVNNPLGFLNGSIANAQDYVNDLLAHLDLYQKHHGTETKEIHHHANAIELDFVRDDFPLLLESMQQASDRIQQLSSSLRSFSRADADQKVAADIHDGIDSTLLILKYRLKANPYRPAIQICRQYGSVPSVCCFPGQLNQVFMNVFANAIDMFDEIAQQQSIEDLKANPQTIMIQTRCIPNPTIAEQLETPAISLDQEETVGGIWGEATDDDWVEIRIGDNGKGMTQEILSQIFDHLFTTKCAAKGTGLGLAIAHQIVTEVHAGILTVTSEVNQGTNFYIRLPVLAQTE